MIQLQLKPIWKRENPEKGRRGVKIKLIKKLRSVENVWDVIEQKTVVVVMFVHEKNMGLLEIRNDVNNGCVLIHWEGKYVLHSHNIWVIPF